MDSTKSGSHCKLWKAAKPLEGIASSQWGRTIDMVWGRARVMYWRFIWAHKNREPWEQKTVPCRQNRINWKGRLSWADTWLSVTTREETHITCVRSEMKEEISSILTKESNWKSWGTWGRELGEDRHSYWWQKADWNHGFWDNRKDSRHNPSLNPLYHKEKKWKTLRKRRQQKPEVCPWCS